MLKKPHVYPLLRMVVFSVLISFKMSPTFATSEPSTPELSFSTIEITAPKGKIIAELADTEKKQNKGLSKRPNLPKGHGMLFTYNYVQAQGNNVWMTNMYFPIDIVWINADKKVSLVQSNISPNRKKQTEAKVYYSATPMPFILKLPAGDAQRLGITKGTVLSFDLSQSINPEEKFSYPTTKISAPKGAIVAYVPDTDPKFDAGLGKLESLPKGHGMLFPFGEADNYVMWMKDMRFAIDILWLDKHKEVVHLKANISPDTYQEFEADVYFAPKPNAYYVLELPAGDAKRLGIDIGTKLQFDLPKNSK